MRYLADALTFIRFILAFILIAVAISSSASIGAGFLLFTIAELTDAFDGTLATKYPFPKNKTPKYRKYAAKYDMVADTLTAFAAVLFFIIRVNFVFGLIVVVGYGIIAIAVDMLVYGRLFGHPDNCAPDSLIKRNFPLAKKIIMMRRALYLILIAVIAFWFLYASEWLLTTKIIISIIAIFVAIFLWSFLAQRRHHISRDAVDIEKKLTQNKRR